MSKDKKIFIAAGSKSDLEVLSDGLKLLEELDISYNLEVISAHRHPDKLRKFSKNARKYGAEVVIACAGMAAALPGFIASYTDIPVIGVALKGGVLDGLDALLSMVSIPKGIGLASTGIGKSAFINAVILSLEILALKDKDYLLKLKAVKDRFK